MARPVLLSKSSAVVQETVSQVLSCLVHKYEEKEEPDAKRNLERLEMAHIRLEAALKISERWQITDASLLRWHRKLKCAAQECNDMIQKCKLRILEDEKTEQEVRSLSLPNRIVHATKSFVFSILSRNNKELNRSIAQRFEWYADCASEFLRFIELGGTPCRHMPFDSLVKNLLAGKELHYKIVQGNGYPSFQLSLVPLRTEWHGTEANLRFIKNDGTPEGNIYFTITCRVENIREEFIQLLTQDLSWIPSVSSYQRDQLLALGSQWFRPNPLCCKQHDGHEVRIGRLDMSGLSEVLLEPVLEVNLQCQVSLSVHNKRLKALLPEGITSLQGSPYLKAGISFGPHRSSESMLPANRISEMVVIVGEEQHYITLEELEEIILPGAIDYFHRNTKATVYQIIWKSKHGTAHIQIEKASMRVQRDFGGVRKRKLLQPQDQELWSWVRVNSHLLGLWGAHMPVQLRSILQDYLQTLGKSVSGTNNVNKYRRHE
ncbi:hypothetical protein U9M48_001887 [Paspalum notatum var. saurae]|uniref:Disease resistance N-terminal domain-containing protein n=1 Tax=Paspalum notatum var. saurae TaxID=547442 RepID=A0AAQ3PGB2_PASNO